MTAEMKGRIETPTNTPVVVIRSMLARVRAEGGDHADGRRPRSCRRSTRRVPSTSVLPMASRIAGQTGRLPLIEVPQ